MEKTLLLHIAAGGVALLAGYPALFAHKGGALHRSSGTVFAWAMVVMGASALAVTVTRGLGMYGGVLPIYMVVTGVAALRPPTVRVRRLTMAMMFVGFTFAASATYNGLQAMRGVPALGSEDVPIPAFFIIATIVGSAAIGDAALLRFGPWTGRVRLARHLWRMCFALYAAAGSFFMGQAQLIPRPLRIMPVLIAISVLPLIAMFYWLWRVHRRSGYAHVSRRVTGQLEVASTPDPVQRFPSVSIRNSDPGVVIRPTIDDRQSMMNSQPPPWRPAGWDSPTLRIHSHLRPLQRIEP